MRQFTSFTRLLGLLVLISVSAQGSSIQPAEKRNALAPPLPARGNTRITPVCPPYVDPTAFVYAIATNGDLLWYRRDGITGAWTGPRTVNYHWDQFRDVIPAGGNRIYAVTNDGRLLWYQHLGFNDGTNAWNGPIEVGHGWNFSKIVAEGDGVVFATQTNGTLSWYRHYGYLVGGDVNTWIGPSNLFGTWLPASWRPFTDMFAMGQDVFYLVHSDGVVSWFQVDLSSQPAVITFRDVNTGLQNMKSTFAVGSGVMFAIANDGRLLRYKHVNYLHNPGAFASPIWEGPLQIGNGWASFRKVFALLPTADGSIH
jgi:hypothetical protein